MAEAYESLGKNIVIGRIVAAGDVAGVQDFILHELARRSLSPAAGKDVLTPEDLAKQEAVAHICENCAVAGFSGAGPESHVPVAGELEPYISYMKNLYLKILKA